VKRKGIDILFAVDTSRSMLAEDLKPNRLERARLGILDFVDKLEGDRVGLIPFSGSAFALCPLTLDYDAFRESLNALDTDLIPRQGTDLASAVKEADRLFDETGNNHRVLVLLTDGEDLEGEVDEAVKAAANKQMAIYTVGVGSTEGAAIPIRYQNGRSDYLRDSSGEVVRTKLDEETLRKIAEQTNALYVPLGRGAEGLNTIYQEKLRLVPPTERNQRMQRIPLERFEWPLGLAVFLLVIEFFIRDRRRTPDTRRLTATAAGAACVILAMGDRVSANPDARVIYNEGTTAYTAGDFDKAAESLRSSLRTADLSLQQKSYYNLGNALYRTGQGNLEKDPETTIKNWEESIKAYQDALSLDATDEDAAYNKELVTKKLEELKKQQKNEDQDSEENKDEEQKDGEQKDGEQKDGEQKDGEQKDGEQKDGEQKDGEQRDGEQKDGEQKDGEQKDGEQKDGEQKDGEQKDGEQKDGEQKDGEQKDGEQKDGEQKDGEQKDGEQKGQMSNERVSKEQMTPEEARQLLEALRGDERTVIPIPQQPRGRFLTPDNSTKGKTW
jgi:Ca-activated chloride channel family protein